MDALYSAYIRTQQSMGQNFATKVFFFLCAPALISLLCDSYGFVSLLIYSYGIYLVPIMSSGLSWVTLFRFSLYAYLLYYTILCSSFFGFIVDLLYGSPL